MTTASDTAASGTSPVVRPTDPGPDGRGVRWGRVLIGLLLTAAGGAWLLDATGVAVPWRLLPATAVILAGVLLLASLAGGTGRADVVVTGIVLLVAAVGVGVGADRFAGPVGDRTIGADAADWDDTTTRRSAGTVVVDLTRAAPPPGGRLQIEVGAGTVEVRLPAGSTAGAPLRIDARLVAGTVRVDGVPAQQGVDLRWTDPADRTGRPADAVLTIDIGAGDLEVHHGST